MVIRRYGSGVYVAAIFVVAAALITGCTAPSDVAPSPTPTSSPTSAPSSSATPSAGGDSSVPVSLPCDSVITPQHMYDFSPSFVLVSAFSPEAGSLAAVAAGFDGTVCRWLHETSQVSIDVSVAQPDAASLEVLRSTASSGTLIMDVGDEAFFDVVDGVGATQVFSGSFWLTVASAYFTSPTDGAELVDVIVGSVR